MLPISPFGRKSALTQTDHSEPRSLKPALNQQKSALMQTDNSESQHLKPSLNQQKSALRVSR
jgi:hypothetical protein